MWSSTTPDTVMRARGERDIADYEALFAPLRQARAERIDRSRPVHQNSVRVDGPIPPDPGYLEIHFYQDHIEAAISGGDGPSPPRLKLQSCSDFAR